MKHIFLAAVLMTGLSIKAQIVNIPDPYFKYILLSDPNINTNGDNEIQETEAVAVTNLTIGCTSLYFPAFNAPLDITGIKSFINLERLEINTYCSDGGGIRRIDVDGMRMLRFISINDTATRIVTAKNCSNLDTFLIEAQFVTRIDSVDCSGDTNLLNFSSIINADIRKCILHGCTNLRSLQFMSAEAIETPLSEFPNIEGISFMDIQSTSLDFSVFHGLKTLYIGEALHLTNINFTGCSSLSYLSLYAPLVTTYDLSSCYSLQDLILEGNNSIEYINIKNGRTLSGLLLGTSAHINTICADEFEISSVIQQLSQVRATCSYISSYCSFLPGGSFNTIKGTVRIDLNNNGCDSTDRGLQNIIIKLRDTTRQTYISSDSTGFFKVHPYTGNFYLTPYFPYPYFTISPTSTTVTFDTANSLTTTRDFCITPSGIHNDLSISLLPSWPRARPGMAATYVIIYKNRGTTTLSGNVSVNFDNSKINFVSASENVTSQSTGQLIWNYSNLQPFETRTIYVTFNLLPPPVNNIGDTVQYLASITPSANDETAFDNSFILPQRVVGSYDPNDKQCVEGSKLDISKIGDYLHYIIHFQNQGTDTAFNIVVADTLSNNLDWSSFEFIGSSHTCDPVLKNNKAEFYFSNINLPYKAINEPASNGWVAFKIKPKPSVVIGDSINNTAAIYFDFNLPVITNRATTVVTSSSVPVPVKLEYFSVAQKNNTNMLNWKASCSYGNAAFVIERSNDAVLFSSIGNISATALRCQLPFNFTDNNPVAGKNYYRIKITDADGKSFYSKVLVAGNSKAGIAITAVVNNTVYISSNKQQPVTVKLLAIDGKELFHQKQSIAAGNNIIMFPLKNTSKGIYMMVVYTNEGESVVKKFIR